jgi:hypothetical protein
MKENHFPEVLGLGIRVDQLCKASDLGIGMVIHLILSATNNDIFNLDNTKITKRGCGLDTVKTIVKIHR